MSSLSAALSTAINQLKSAMPNADDTVVQALAPSGTLRAGINLSNFLLVTDKTDDGEPVGVSPGMATVLAELIGCGVEYRCFASPGEVADAAKDNQWDIGNIGADPARAAFIAFTDAYCEIESTCLLPAGSPIKSFADVDQPGIRIATKHRAAYTLWLERNLKNAELIQVESIDASFHAFVDQKLDVLAGLRPRLLDDAARLPGSTILADKFAAVQQAIGTPNNRDKNGADYLQRYVELAKQTGLVQALIDQHGVNGKLSVAT
jgi:polar amino acid transport system substrate-binding protein